MHMKYIVACRSTLFLLAPLWHTWENEKKNRITYAAQRHCGFCPGLEIKNSAACPLICVWNRWASLFAIDFALVVDVFVVFCYPSKLKSHNASNWMWFRLFVLFPFVFSFTAPFEHSRLKCWTLLMALTHLARSLLVYESAFFYVQPAIKCIRCISHSIGIVFCSAVQCWHLGNLGIQLCASNSFRDSWIYLLMHVSMQIDGHSEMPISRK